MKNYGTIKINGVKVIGVFKIAGHDWALYMPPCEKDKNDEPHAYKRFIERKVDFDLLKAAIEKHCDEVIEIAMKTVGNKKEPVIFRWRNATIVIVVGMWHRQVLTLGIVTVVDDYKEVHKDDRFVFNME